MSNLAPVSYKCEIGYMMSITQTETLLCDPRTACEMPLYHSAARDGLVGTAGKFTVSASVRLAISLG